ncbi:MAG: hypothetical protein ACOYBX_06995 [Mycobacterium sp.]
MTQSVGLSVRSFLTAGVSAAVVGAVALTPVTVSQPAAVAAPIHLIAPQIELASLGTDIKAVYNAAEPWAAYAAEVATYALGFVPGLWWVAPGIDLAYFTIEPLVQAGVYAFADLVDLDFPQIPIDVSAGLNEAANNFVTYGLAWVASLVPLPPLPPLPPFPGAALRPSAAARAVPARAAGRLAAAAVAATEAPAVAEVAVADVAPVTAATPRSRRGAGPAATGAPQATATAAATTGAAAASDGAASDGAGAKSSAHKSRRA